MKLESRFRAWVLPALAVTFACVAAVAVFRVADRLSRDDIAAVEAAVAAVQAFGALIVMIATVTLVRLTAAYVTETRRLADLSMAQESWRHRVKAADELVSCLEDIRWNTSEQFGTPANLTPNDVRAQCRDWHETWRLNRVFITDITVQKKAEDFEKLTREARADR